MTRANTPWRGKGGQRAQYARGNSGTPITIEGVEIVRETANAILIKHAGAEHWIPLSQTEKILRRPNGQPADITISAWIAEKKGITK